MLARFHIPAMLSVMFALGIAFPMSAFAEEGLKWLFDGGSTLTKEKSEITGKLRLSDTKVPIIGHASVECSSSLDGTIGAGETEGEIVEILNSAGEKMSTTPLSGVALSCVAVSGCETSTTPLVWVTGLPFKSKVELSLGRPVDQIIKSGGGSLGFEVTSCLVLGVSLEDECTGEFFGEPVLENMLGGSPPSDLLAVFGGGKGLCSQSKEASGTIEGETSIFLTSGLELTVSGDGVTD
jgi:hypothetical protein